MTTKTDIIVVKKTKFEYHKQASFTAGLKLEGWMVKAIRAGNISISGSAFVRPQNGEMFLFGLHIKPLEQANSFSAKNPDPVIKLLLNRREIDSLIGAEQRDGCTVVLHRLFFKDGLIKAEIWLAKGKKQHDKRQTIKERDDKRSAQRAMKNAGV